MNTDSFEAVWGSPADAQSILNLINLVQPQVPWSLSHFQWQFRDSPYGPAKLYLVKKLNGQVVSLYAAIAQRIAINGKSFQARMVQDVMTHPDYRGRGFLHDLGRRCLDDIRSTGEIGYTFPNERSEKSFRRNGWKELCPIPTRIKLLDKERSSDVKNEVEVLPLKGPFGNSLAEIWKLSNLQIGVDRNTDFLNWRYSKPNIEYRKFIINSGEGLLILKFYSSSNEKSLHICDLFVKENCQGIIPSILSFCEDLGRTEKANFLTAWLPEKHPYADPFNAVGLKIQNSSSRFFFVYPTTESIGLIQDPTLWHLSHGDSDVY